MGTLILKRARLDVLHLAYINRGMTSTPNAHTSTRLMHIVLLRDTTQRII